MKSTLTILLALAAGGCSSQLETYQDEVHRQKVDSMIAETIHERNFRIWLDNQREFIGTTPFKTTAPCPAMSGHAMLHQ